MVLSIQTDAHVSLPLARDSQQGSKILLFALRRSCVLLLSTVKYLNTRLFAWSTNTTNHIKVVTKSLVAHQYKAFNLGLKSNVASEPLNVELCYGLVQAGLLRSVCHL